MPSSTTADPRSIVTPDAFSVAPALLGTPLAPPWRRMAALAIDLVLILILQLLGWSVLAGVAALTLFRMATKAPAGAAAGPAKRAALGCAGALILVAGVAVVWVAPLVFDRVPSSPDDGDLTLTEALAGIGAAQSLATSEGDEDALESALQLAARMSDAGMEREVVLTAIASLAVNNPRIDGAALSALVADSLFGGAPAAETGDGGSAPPPASPEATRERALLDTISALRLDAARLRDDLRAGREEARAQVEPPSTLFTWIRDAADEAGLVFGWGTVYLTLFLALWQGRTPGKRAMGLRVVRLNGQPIGLYLSLERAGGYAAGVATGLLGFAQVWWDPNRQAIHDKIAETVVVRDGAPRSLRGLDAFGLAATRQEGGSAAKDAGSGRQPAGRSFAGDARRAGWRPPDDAIRIEVEGARRLEACGACGG